MRLQLLVADGHGRCPPRSSTPRSRGHAIEARLYAEDATRGLAALGRAPPPLPRSRPSAGVRVDSGVEDGSEVSVHYDPMLAKVIAHAPTRDEAARALAGALDRAQIHGVTTNRDLLVRILRHPEFLAGDIDTGFLVRHDPAVLGAPLADAGGATAARRRRRPGRPGRSAGPRRPVLRRHAVGVAQQPLGAPDASPSPGPTATVDVGYRFDRAGTCTLVAVDGDGPRPTSTVRVVRTRRRRPRPSDGVTRRYDVDRVGPDGLRRRPRRVVGVRRDRALPAAREPAGRRRPRGPAARDGGEGGGGRRRPRCAAGDTLVAIEAMKMEHEVRAAVGRHRDRGPRGRGRAGRGGAPARGRRRARRRRAGDA